MARDSAVRAGGIGAAPGATGSNGLICLPRTSHRPGCNPSAARLPFFGCLTGVQL